MKAENIKFRAKRTDDGAWVYGDLQHVHRINTKEQVEQSGRRSEPVVRVAYSDVDEETIGQYTGLYDENGSEIYEGDIVDWTFFYTGYCNGGAVERDTIVTGIIEWYQGGFILKVINNDYVGAGQYSIPSLNTDTTSDVVIKGNIYDNKELLTQGYGRID